MNSKLALVVLAGVLWPATALAVRAPATARPGPGERELVDGRVRRVSAPHQWRAAAEPARARAFDALAAELGSAWATWDPEGGHPRQILATGLHAPGTVASAAEAERVATELLARHVELLAPGASASDFVVVANDLSGDLRSVGFAQRSAGREVVGGQIGMVFAHDRLVMITSLAQPHAYAAVGTARVTDSLARERARGWIDADLRPARIRTPGAVEGPLLLPVGDASTGPAYREVLRLDVRSEAPFDRHTVYVDAQTGEPVARESRMHTAVGQLLYNVPDRSPIFSRSNRPAPFTNATVNGVPGVTDGTGLVSFPGTAANVQPGLSGPFATIVDEAGPLASTTLFLPENGSAIWNVSNQEFADAQLATYVHSLEVKAYVRAIDPSLAWLDQTVIATVNIDDECNAMSDGDSLFFLRSSPICENTGRMSDVVYHEAGHSVHNQSIIPGVGAFDGALSEGVSDYLAATMLNDSGMGRGFFYTEEPLRELDPEGFEWTWPEDAGEIHDAGRIIAGTLWDLRTLLIAKYGPSEGVRRADIIYYEGTRRAVDMPSMYGAALIVNDDDGNVGNGTPDACEINAAFGAHGLFSSIDASAEKVRDQEIPEGLLVHVDLALPTFEACPLSATARIEFGPRDGDGTTQIAEMFPVEGGYEALVPALPAGQVLRYRVLVDYSVGTTRVVPPNLADPWFQHWFGEVVPLYCTSFDGALAEGWSTPAPWDVDVPLGLAGDPGEAGGADPFVLGLDLNGDGFYVPWSTATAVSPPISIPLDTYGSVRLHYRRWLTVEDGFYDQAWIYADGSKVWGNFASASDEEGATTHHRDQQWVFHDVDLTSYASDGLVQLAFELSSDGGLEMGGWNIDELCVVGFAPGAAPSNDCGNGVVDAGETCDDGNRLDGDGCSATCNEESGSDDDGGVDPENPQDTGLVDDGELIGRGCVCNSRPERGGYGSLGILALLVLLRRRRVTRC